MDKQLGKRKMGESSRPRIVYPRLLVEPFKSTPIVEIPDTPQRPEFYTIKEFEEEREKLWEMHIELNNQYEEKLRQAVMYLVDRIEWPTFYDQLARIVPIWDEIKGDEDKLRPIV